MLQTTVVQFNSYMVHATLSDFTDGCVSRVDLKKKKIYFSLLGLLQKEVSLL